jgi:chromate transporter
MSQPAPSPSFDELFRFFAWLGCVSFGGPAGQIAILREELVVRRRWLTSREFSDGLNFCMLLPGPEAHQLVIYSGWKLHGLPGAIAAGVLFVLPAALLLWALSVAYVYYGARPEMQTILGTMRPVVLAIIIAAVVRMAGNHLTATRDWALAAAAFALMLFLGLPFPWVIVAALVLGAVRPTTERDYELEEDSAPVRRTPWLAVFFALVLWAAPIVWAASVFGPNGLLTWLGLFFSKVAVITFGGAYAVLPYVADYGVYQAGWLSSAAMRDGLALAETTPGPLIIVLQFVGFLAGWGYPGSLPPLTMATLAAAITTWVTFLPSLVFVLLGAPQVERLARNARARAIMQTVSAAVVGVIANLAAWFAAGVFTPPPGAVAIKPFIPAAITGVALWLLTSQGWSVPRVIMVAVLAGVVRVAVAS